MTKINIDRYIDIEKIHLNRIYFLMNELEVAQKYDLEEVETLKISIQNIQKRLREFRAAQSEAI